MKKKYFLLLTIIILFVLSSCRSYQPPETFYYTLDYLSYTENPELERDSPLPYSVLVHPVEIPRTYSRRNIVIRHFGPKISFAERDLWAGRLSDYLPRIISSRLHAYNVFTSASLEHLTAVPDMEIETSLHRMELVQSEALSEAHLEISFFLNQRGTGDNTIVYNGKRIKPLYDSSIELYVQTINEMILEETDRFIEKIYEMLDPADGITPETDIEPAVMKKQDIPDAVSGFEGQGVMLMPALSGIKGLGKYRVIDRNGNVFIGEYGIDLPLDEGLYTVEYGSGTQDFLMTRRGVRVNSGYRTLVEPDWGALTVEIHDERREPQEVIYELFDGTTGQSYGSEYPAREELGDPPRVWHLQPGVYRITINNQPFNTLKDFTTVQVEEGRWKRLTIVVDSSAVPMSLIGAGLLDETERGITEGNWTLSSSVHASMDFQASHENRVEDASFSYDLLTQLDNHLRFSAGRFSLSIMHYSELGLDYERDKELKISSDIFDLRNSGVIDLIGGIGLYTRFDVNSHLFPIYDYERFTEPSTCRIFDSEGKLIEEKTEQTELLIAPSFYPLILKEGIGLNLRLLNNPRSNLTFRGGFGLRQEFNKDVIRFVDKEDNTTFNYTELDDRFSAGLELSALGFFQPFSRVQINTIADVLFPFVEGDDITFQWETGLNFVLLRYLSFNYQFIMQTDTSPVTDETYFKYDQRLLFRLTYILN